MITSAREHVPRVAGYFLMILVCVAGTMATHTYAGSIVISEIMYHPLGESESEPSDFEFVEVYNAGTVSKDLSGYEFTNSIAYRFPAGVILPVGAYLVVVGNQQQFGQRYPDVGTVAPGSYTRNLGNDGETLTLANALGTVVFSVDYNDSKKWPQRADGHGSSLMLIDPSGDPDEPGNWCASDTLYGTPGKSGQCAVSDVVINEVLTHSDPPFEDAIELQNISADPINIGGWYLSDDAEDRRKYRIPTGTLIQGHGGFRVFYENEFNDSGSVAAFALSSAYGDEVYLTASDASGNLTRFADMAVFEASENGVSFGRYPDGIGPVVTLSGTTFGVSNPTDVFDFRTGTGGPNTPPREGGPVVVSEIMYHPPDSGGLDNPDNEYIELHNITDRPIQLLDPDNPANTWKITSAVDFVFPLDVTIPADGYILIVGTENTAGFRTAYHLGGTVPIYGPWTGRLNNSGESVRLYRPDAPGLDLHVPYVLVDRVDYSDNHPWPAGPDGSGYSLERRTPPGLGSDRANWQVGILGGSPGTANLSAPIEEPDLFINEFTASNDSTCATDVDWIEIYNPLEQSVDIGGFYLTDNLDNPNKWEIPQNTSIAAGGFVLLYADGTDTGNHTNFQLSNAGESIGLYSREGLVIDSITFGSQETDVSSGRQPDGSDAWFYFDDPTCGATNGMDTGQVVVASPEFSLSAGYYTSQQMLVLSTETSGAVIYYTRDGSEPDEQSERYNDTPITIKSRTGDLNAFSAIPTNADPGWMPLWTGPSGEVFKATVIRARAFVPNEIPSEIITRTYFVDPDMFERYATLPVISLVSDRKHLFDDATGIYVPGNLHTDGDTGSGNYSDGRDPITNKRWEKPAHIEFFEPDGDLGFSQTVGIRIQGNTSQWGPQKGVHVIARGRYGKNRIDYPIFETSRSKANKLTRFKRFVLRSWGSRRANTLLTDAHAQVLMAESSLDIVDYRPAVVFINGEYWGLHELREFNKSSWYYQHHYGIDRDNPGIDLMAVELQWGGGEWPPLYVADEGDLVHWNSMTSQITARSLDMSLPENYDYIETQMDIDNFLDYVGHSVFTAKWDWPNHNEGSWRPRTPDGRWKWLQYDMEALLPASGNSIDYLFSGYWRRFDIWVRFGPHPLVLGLSNWEKDFGLNRKFLDPFINWFADHMNTNLSSEFAIARLDEMVAELAPYMPEYRERWQLNYDWDYRIQEIRNFFNARPGYMKGFITNFFDFVTGTAKITINDPGNGSIRINQIIIDEETPGITNLSYPWTGTYFIGVPIELTAIPDEGQQFVQWQGAIPSAENPITIDVTGNTAITAIFEKALPDDPVVNDKTVTTDEDIPKVTDLSATDVGSEEWTYAIVSSPAHGTLTGTPPTITYTPAADHNGSDTFTFKANNGYVDSNIATVTVTIRAVNDPPVADNQAVTTEEDTPIGLDVPATDVDSASLTYTIKSLPIHGTINGTPLTITYTPVADYNGSDTFTFTANDGTVDSNPAVIAVTINPVNDAPTISGSPSTLAGAVIQYTFTPTADDVDDGDLWTFRIDNRPAWAGFDNTTGTLSGTPGAGNIGTYTDIVITVVDGSQAETSLPAFDLRVIDAGILGDVDNDGFTDGTDILLIVGFIFGEKSPNEQEYISANIDTSNPSIDISDLLELIDIIEN